MNRPEAALIISDFLIKVNAIRPANKFKKRRNRFAEGECGSKPFRALRRRRRSKFPAPYDVVYEQEARDFDERSIRSAFA